jgi:hypothetical protein
MNKFLSFTTILLAILFFACNNSKQTDKPENDIDAARDFIRAALDGKFDEARKYLLQDSSNLQFLNAVERNYAKMDAESRGGYRSASINIHLVEPVNDSTTIVVYSNSFKNDHDTLRVLKKSSTWLVDLKYLFTQDRDTIYKKVIIADSLSVPSPNK